jgi:hypothetical protein
MRATSDMSVYKAYKIIKRVPKKLANILFVSQNKLEVKICPLSLTDSDSD